VGENADLIRAMLPSPEADIAHLFRDQDAFESTVAALAGILDPNLESVAVWAGEGRTYKGIDGFRQLWLDWLEPWDTYQVQVDEIIEAGDRVAVLIRDHGRRHDTDAEVELISGSVWMVRDGKIARAEFYANRNDLFEATGLRPASRGATPQTSGG
jgi:ketosteroid isomerase-like protein